MNNQTNDAEIQGMFDKAFSLIEEEAKKRKNGPLLDAINYARTHVVVKWNTRRRIQLGVASWMKFGDNILSPMIQLNTNLFHKLTYEQKYQTVSHEAAHIVDAYFRGKSSHDATWQTLHFWMGGDGKRLLDIPGITVKRNKVQRVCILDVQTGKEYKTTVRQAARAVRCNPARYQEIGRFMLGSEPLTDH